MLSLQLYTKRGWVPVGEPYAPADTQGAQQAATTLSRATGAVWRVVGEGERVLSLWNGRRWQTVAETQPIPASWWDQDSNDDPITVPQLYRR